MSTQGIRVFFLSAVAGFFFLASMLGIPAHAQVSDSQVHIEPRTSAQPATGATAATLDNDDTLRTHTRPFRSEVDLVLVPVTVTDSQDRLVTGLDKKNFVIYQDNEKQELQHLSTEDAPVSIGIILDMSGSMNDKMENARQAVLEFLKVASPQDEFFVIGFSDRPELVADFTKSIETIQSQMVLTRAKGLTSLLDAIYLGLRQMRKAQNPRRALLVISDGGDNHSRYTEKEVKSLVQEADVQIYGIGIFDASPSTEEERNGPLLLNDITEATGGRVFTVDNSHDLADAAAKIGIQLRHEYVLGYRPKAVDKNGKWHKIKVKLIPPKGLPRLFVSAKKGFYAPAD